MSAAPPYPSQGGGKNWDVVFDSVSWVVLNRVATRRFDRAITACVADSGKYSFVGPLINTPAVGCRSMVSSKAGLLTRAKYSRISVFGLSGTKFHFWPFLEPRLSRICSVAFIGGGGDEGAEGCAPRKRKQNSGVHSDWEGSCTHSSMFGKLLQYNCHWQGTPQRYFHLPTTSWSKVV